MTTIAFYLGFIKLEEVLSLSMLLIWWLVALTTMPPFASICPTRY